MANATSNTIFAQRMGLRQRLLDQAREDKVIEDDRKVKLIAELNRSTDFALQAQGKAMERKRADAAAMSEQAAFLDKEAPSFDMESGAVRDAAERGAGAGATKSEKMVREQVAQRMLEKMKQEGADQRTVYSQTQQNARTGASIAQRQGEFDDPDQVSFRSGRAQKMGIDLETEAELRRSQIWRNLHPPGGISILPNLKEKALGRFAKLEAQYPTAFSKSPTFGSEAERAVSQTIRDKINAAREQASRAYDLAAGKEIDPGKAHMAGEFAMQKEYDALMADPAFNGATQQAPGLTPFAPVAPSGTSTPRKARPL